MHVDTSQPSFGLASQRSSQARMTVAHQHDDIEFNFAPTGLRYRIDGTVVEMPPQRMTAFWGARPHQLIDDAPDEWVHWLTVPLGMLMSWTVPDGFVTRLLRGEVLQLEDDVASPHALSRLTQWTRDLGAGTPWAEGTVRLEMEAYLRRVSVTPLGQLLPAEPTAVAPRPSALAGRMAEFIAARSAEPITVADVARAVHVHPGYAMTAFRRGVGTTIGSYLTQCRVAHAQRLLLTSDLPVHDVGIAAGFSSVSQFYDRFSAACGTSPGAYRRAHLRPAG